MCTSASGQQGGPEVVVVVVVVVVHEPNLYFIRHETVWMKKRSHVLYLVFSDRCSFCHRVTSDI